MRSSEIAKLAGVSRSTVSRVINGNDYVQEETRKRVQRIIEQYDYEPDTSARALVGKPNKTVGLFIVGVNNKDAPNRIHKSGYFAPFMEIIVDAVSSYGYFTLTTVLNSTDDYDKIRQAFLQKRIACGIILGTQTAVEVYERMLDKGYPMAIIDLDPEECRRFRGGQANLTIVNSMNYEGAYEAVEYLHGLGHTEIGFIAGLMCTYSARERYRAFMDAMRNLELPIREEFILKGEFNPNCAVAEIKRLLTGKALPTALFSSNDDMALTAIDVFKTNGIRVPQDMSIVGFDDIYVAAHTNPALTTVMVPMIEMAKKAADSMVKAIEEKDRSQVYYNLPTKLIVRDSCAGRAGLGPPG